VWYKTRVTCCCEPEKTPTESVNISNVGALEYVITLTTERHSIKEALRTIQADMSQVANNVRKFKEVVKKYWYIAVPVHLVGCAGWFGLFYGATKLGLNFVPILEKTSIPEKYVEPLKKGNIGNLAQAVVMYKLVTPVRYGTTLAVTRSAIIHMRKRGILK